jgi:hypothetical protein
MNTIDQLAVTQLQRHVRDDGELVVADCAVDVGFAIARLFTVTASVGAERGKHAHRRCAQFMLCVSGAVDILCDDGRDRRTFPLDSGNLALLVPPTIWATVLYRQDSALAVLCDRAYEADDYIRNYSEFLTFRGLA